MIGLILGHRGAPAELPENTMRGFRRAVESGADGVELDVRLSADGVPVVIHDDTVDRTTDGSGRVAELTWAEISRLRVRPTASAAAAAADATDVEPERVPRLDEVVHWATSANAFVNIELKSAGSEPAAVGVVQAAGILSRVLFSSFIPDVVAEVGRAEPSAHRYLITEHWDPVAREAVRSCGARGLCLADQAATAHTLAELARDGLPVVVWTVDDPVRLSALLEGGVAAVITNDPGHAAAIRSSTHQT